MTNGIQPKVAVVITHHSFYRLPMLMDALHALNCQTYPCFTVYIVDDSQLPDLFHPAYKQISNGFFPRIIKKPLPSNYRGEDKGNYIICDSDFLLSKGARNDLEAIKPTIGIKIVQPKEKCGASRAANIGIDLALSEGCEFIRILDGDDVPLYNAFEIQLNVLLNNPQINLATSDKLEFGIGHMGYQSKCSSDPDMMRGQALFWGACVYKTAVMFRASILDQFPNGQLFDDSYTGIGDDIIMNARFGQVGGIGYIPLPLVYYRRHADNLSHKLLHVFKEDYARSIRQIFKENCGVEVSKQFSYRYYECFHRHTNTQFFEELTTQAREYISQCKYGNVEKILQIVDQAIMVVGSQPKVQVEDRI